MKNEKFPKFWFDSNACFGYVESITDLRNAFIQNTSKYSSVRTFVEFLNLCKQHSNNESLNFGLRVEHSGVKTLYQFLSENGVDLNAI